MCPSVRRRAAPPQPPGQSLVELALVTPLLFLLMLGILDFARIFFSYVTVSNAARTGARYVSVYPDTPPDQVSQVVVGEAARTLDYSPGCNCLWFSVVTETYRYGIIDPVNKPLLSGTVTVTLVYSQASLFFAQFVNAMTGWWGGPTLPTVVPISVHAVMPIALGMEALPTPTPSPTVTPSPSPTPTPTPTPRSPGGGGNRGSPTPTPTSTPTPTPTGTPTPTPTATSTPTPTPSPTPTPKLVAYGRAIYGSVLKAEGSVPQAGAFVEVILDGALIATAVTDGVGAYRVEATNSGSPLPGNRLYTVRATYGLLTGSADGFLPAGGVANINVTVGGTPTPTPGTVTPTPTPAPVGAPVLSGNCTLTTSGSVSVTQNSLSWTTVSGAVRYNVYQSADYGRTFVFIGSTSGTSYAVTVGNNTRYDYVVTAVNSADREGPASNAVAVVCGNPPTPTPTPTGTPTPTTLPDLLVTSLVAQGPRPNQEPRVGDPVTVKVTIQNASGAPVAGLFYLDVYVDQPPMPGTPGFAWVAVNGLGAGATKTFTFTYTFSVPGSHFFQAQVDTYNQVREGSESNNVSVPYPVAVQGTTLTPTPTPATPTPTATPTPAAAGAVEGTVWANTGAGFILAPRATVRVLTGSTVVIETLSGPDGRFVAPNLAPGTYTVAGSLCAEGRLYADTVPGVGVTAGQTTQVTLILQNVGGTCAP